MAVLFQSDFEDSSGTIVVPNGAAGFTVDGQYLVFDASIVSLTAVSGARIMASSDTPDRARYTASGSLTGQAVRHASKWQSHSTPHVSGHVLRYVDASSYYYVYPQTDGSSLRLIAFRYEGGSTQIAVTSYVLPCSVGDVIHHESKMVGTTIESRIWKNSESRPSTATLSVTDSTYSSGYPGLVKIGAGGTYAAVDQLVITDGAGGEDYFYPESAGSSATLTATTATPAFSGSAQVAPLTSITVTTASPTFSGGASSGLAEATVTATTASPAFSGSATGDVSQGTLTLPVLKNNTGTILANETGATVHVYAVSTGNKIVTKTGQTTNGSGVMSVTDALIVAATQYRVVVVLGSGAEGLDKVTAS